MNHDPATNPFQRTRQRYVDSAREYRHFLDFYPEIYDDFRASNPRFRQLAHWISAFVEEHHIEKPDERQILNGPPPVLQFQFGLMPLGLGRRTNAGAVASENGATLVYSFGPTGYVAVMLYPAKGELGSANESTLLLRVGRYSGWQLHKDLRRDLRDWTSYMHVTALDGDPTWRERLRIDWLRLKQVLYVENKPQPARLPELIKKTAKAVFGAGVGAIFRVASVLVAGYFTGTYLS